ncbi:hypothetical protein RvY_00793-1 [Ramazzottius varieornatus]|uniref:Uncharacterized protein n=1 Tax=Ramazzottius varieornatus TaxID=947166 RepID=A0A1D1UHN7_RAMVA|nr:hypothetical protein RvY_00793-1 [Ramazzottius varieornatus]
MCEYDALPDIGHGCGKNILNKSIVLFKVIKAFSHRSQPDRRICTSDRLGLLVICGWIFGSERAGCGGRSVPECVHLPAADEADLENPWSDQQRWYEAEYYPRCYSLTLLHKNSYIEGRGFSEAALCSDG